MIKLYLASKSQSRQNMLRESKIEFSLLNQNSSENFCPINKSLKSILQEIALDKMDHVILPDSSLSFENQEILVVTADTMGMDDSGKVCGKPNSKQDAIDMIKSHRSGVITGTAFCLDRKIFKNGNWVLVNRIIDYAQAEYIFDVPEDKIEWYLENGFSGISYMDVSGAVTIEGLGAQFLKTINGSYGAVLGLPMYELSRAIDKICSI